MGDNGGSAAHQRAPLSKETSTEFKVGSSDEEDEEESAKPLSHSLSDQLQLLTPTSLRHRHGDQQGPDPTDLYSRVNKRPKKSKSEGEDNANRTAAEKPRSSSLPGGRDSSEEPAEKSLFIHDLTPPWKQMVSRLPSCCCCC